MVEHDPNNLDGYMLLGNILLGEKHPQEAIEIYTKATALKPNDPGPYLNRAVAYNSLKQEGPAEEDLRKAISVDPKAMPAYYALSNFYMNKGDEKKAEETLRLAIQNASAEDPVPYLRLAGLMLHEGRKADGEQVVQQLREKQPEFGAGRRCDRRLLPGLQGYGRCDQGIPAWPYHRPQEPGVAVATHGDHAQQR